MCEDLVTKLRLILGRQPRKGRSSSQILPEQNARPGGGSELREGGSTVGWERGEVLVDVR